MLAVALLAASVVCALTGHMYWAYGLAIGAWLCEAIELVVFILRYRRDGY
jgi:energy-converting hydrogenase Eha subunit C